MKLKRIKPTMHVVDTRMKSAGKALVMNVTSNTIELFFERFHMHTRRTVMYDLADLRYLVQWNYVPRSKIEFKDLKPGVRVISRGRSYMGVGTVLYRSHNNVKVKWSKDGVTTTYRHIDTKDWKIISKPTALTEPQEAAQGSAKQ